MVRYPDGHVLLRNLSREYPTIARGEGPYLYDTDGKKYFDGSGGALVVSLGHGNQEVAARIGAQLAQVAYVNGTQFTSEPTEALANRLCKLSSGLGLDRATFLCSGSEATEAAIKFVRQLWVERGKEKKYKLIARSPSYHGNTLYALSASARPTYKKFFGPLLNEVIVIPAPYEYRSAVSNYSGKGGHYYANALEEAIEREGADTIAAFIFEPIIGSSAGGSLPPPGYFAKVQEICRRHEILMIADEVMVGAGRTGKFFACEHYGIKPDLLTLGKGLNGGYAPLSAVLCKSAHVGEMKAGSGGFMHAQTYMQTPSMTAAGLAVLEVMEKQNLVENSARQGELLHRRLRAELGDHPNVGAISGLGLFGGIEFVEDRPTKKPFDRSRKVAENFVAHAFRNGLILWQNVGHADEINGDLIMLGPPLTLSTEQVEELVQLLKKTIQEFFH